MKIELIGAEQVVDAMKSMMMAVKPNLLEKLTEAATMVEMTMKSNAPKRTGSLANSIKSEVDASDMSADIGPDASAFGGRDAPAAIEYGRRVGQKPPPYTEIADRLGVSPSEAFLIARAISRKGITGTGFINQTLEEIKPVVQEKGIEAAVEIIRRFK